MSEIERICQTQVTAGLESMKITGADCCIISQVTSRHPVGNPHTIAFAEHAQAATENGLHIISVSVTVKSNGQTEVTDDYVILSRKKYLFPDEIKVLVPDYQIPK